MEQTISEVVSSGSMLQLSGLLAIALFFAVVGWRETKQENAYGYFFLSLAVFFTSGHAVQLVTYPADGPLADVLGSMDPWMWIATFLAPALVGLYLLRGLAGLFHTNNREGLVKLFFGLTLVCYLYMLGTDWPVDLKAIIAIIWFAVFLKLELGCLRT